MVAPFSSPIDSTAIPAEVRSSASWRSSAATLTNSRSHEGRILIIRQSISAQNPTTLGSIINRAPINPKNRTTRTSRNVCLISDAIGVKHPILALHPSQLAEMPNHWTFLRNGRRNSVDVLNRVTQDCRTGNCATYRSDKQNRANDPHDNHPQLRELLQKPHVAFVEQLDLLDFILQDGDALYAHAEGEARNPRRVVAVVLH